MIRGHFRKYKIHKTMKNPIYERNYIAAAGEAVLLQ